MPLRPAFPLRAAGLLAALALTAMSAAPVMAAPAAAAAAAATRFTGIWMLAEPYRRAIRTMDGREPPLRPEARRILERRIADRRAGRSEDGVERCLPPGTPRIMWQPRPFMILATPRKITFAHEYQHVLRHVYLDEALPPAEELDPSFGGASVGHWDGDVLVVETAGFNDQTQLDEAGLPHSPDMRVVERLRLLDADTLEDRVTVDDPKAFTATWTARLVFKRAPPGVALQEHNCAETLLDPALRAGLLEKANGQGPATPAR